MARFEIFADGRGYLLDVQSDLIWGLGTRLTVPLLLRSDVPPPTRKLHPTIMIGGHEYVMATHLMAAVPERELGRAVSNVQAHYDEIVGAVEMLFNGF